MNSLLKLSLIAILTLGAGGCAHEARITGPTQCFAPHGFGPHAAAQVAKASDIVRGAADVAVATADNDTAL